MVNLLEKQLKDQATIFEERLAKSLGDVEEKLQTVTDKQEIMKNEIEKIRKTAARKSPTKVEYKEHESDEHSRQNYPEEEYGLEKLEELRQELLNKIQELENKIGSSKTEVASEERQNIVEEIKEKLKEGEEAAEKLKDDAAVDLYARYLALSKELNEYKEAVVKGYNDAQKEIGLNKKCITYNERITALEENAKNDRGRIADLRGEERPIPRKVTEAEKPQVPTEIKEVVRSERDMRSDSSMIMPILLDERKIAEMSGDLGLKVDYIIKAFNELAMSKADRASVKEFKSKVSEELDELNKEMKTAKEAIENSSRLHMELEVDYNKTKKNISDIEAKVRIVCCPLA
eukprot:TRINITY_DN3613_c0_g1_i14.p1 TRINITY_DN3613_c0_g1~~TRINITY_DN3613_c0_g1_i14.p1  ORF type:complete len:346 (-),score=111.57 TRINITY_DN3613_c0_g1_i14:1151-2188(-)